MKLELTRTEPKFTISDCDHAVPKVIYGEKSLVLDFNTLAIARVNTDEIKIVLILY